ncbi:conserved Plasmodium protein, unknown function [Plasmodium ovale wallikeri]|uniref:EF-hand domain-containing protein n=1 Tax=Plasmodium ovale wallikeri TaxID=864142 RepID=A0A1A8ZLN8_PLAOA|nr:conserved Plasmodium protein, unknown function [Plasmodium ovale wallikeri]
MVDSASCASVQTYPLTEKENNKKVIPLTKLMQMLKDKEFTCVTERDSLQLFNAMDLDKDGSLDFEDFVGVFAQKGDVLWLTLRSVM